MQTSLNLPGFSLTCLLLPRDGDKFTSKRILQLIDSPASAPGWTYITTTEPGAAPDTKDTSSPAPVKSGASPVARKLFLSLAMYALLQIAIDAKCLLCPKK